MPMEKMGIVAFAFSVQRTGQNEWISSEVGELARKGRYPIFTQRYFLEFENSLDIEFVQEEPLKPAPTFRIAKEAVQWAIKRGISRLCIIAAPPHRRRCVRDMKFAVRQSKTEIQITVHIDSDKTANQVKWFTKGSGQPRTSSRTIWYLRETIIILFPWLYRWLAR